MLKTLKNNINGLTVKFNDHFKLNITVLIILGIVAQHSFLLKFSGLLLVCFVNYDSLRSFNFRKIPLFYLLLPSLEIIKFLFVNDSYSIPHLSQFLVGFSYWVASLILCWLLYDAVEKGSYISRTINVFAVLNFLFCIAQLIKICLIEHVINPYNTGHRHPYGISSGDLINGLFQGVHLTNAFVSLFLIVFYIHKVKPVYVFICLIPLLLTGSNYATIILFLAMGILFVINRNIYQKGLIASCVVITVLFYWLVTPLNAEYMLEKALHISTTLPNSKKEDSGERLLGNGMKEIIVADTTMPYDVSGASGKKVIVKSTDVAFNFVKQPGKMMSYHQTKDFLLSSVPHFLFGAGMGGFSSKLAFNSSGVMEGSSLNKYLPKYESSWFSSNHKGIYAYLKTQHVMFHSESNRPFSVYNQLLGEYGVIGIVLFVCFYLWYFLKRIRKTSYALPIFVALLCMLNIDYFIESISILLFFELLMFMDIKEKSGGHEL